VTKAPVPDYVQKAIADAIEKGKRDADVREAARRVVRRRRRLLRRLAGL
jgi:aspartate/methionine/tyrosine aminotransferase